MKDWLEQNESPVNGSDEEELLYKVTVEWCTTNSHSAKWEIRYNAVFRTRRPEYLIRAHKILTDIDEGVLSLQALTDTCAFCCEAGHHSSKGPELEEFHRQYGFV